MLGRSGSGLVHVAQRFPWNCNRIGTYFIELAKEDMRRWHVNLPDINLAYLTEGSDHFDEYVEAVIEAQKDLVEIAHTLHQIICVKG
jgi:RNA-splicing ligase RtcB